MATTGDQRSAGTGTLAGLLIGIGLMAGLDEIVFHQLLAWHHLYDRGTLAAGLTADGLLHLTEVLLYVVGVVLLFRVVLRRRVVWGRVGAAIVLGTGVFQLFDGTVDHKVLRLHQVRYGVELWPYDLAWDAVGVALLGVGLLLLRRTSRRAEPGVSRR